MNTAAGAFGRKLNGRKPSAASPRLSESTSRMRSWWIVTESMAKKAAATVASVPASPSMLSSKLNAFVIPTSQKTPNTTASASFEMMCTERPVESTRAAAPTWAASFASGGRERRSIRPATKTMLTPPRIPKSSELACKPPAASAAPTPAHSPAKMPTPPNDGVSLSAQRSPLGRETSRRPADVRKPSQMRNATTGKATTAGTALTGPPVRE